MKIIVPMAGRGSRLRPHTLTIPKPLLPIAGKPIVQRLVEDITAISKDSVDEIAFIIGDFGKEVENDLLKIAENLGAKGSIYYQDQPLGTAHAILCAADSLDGELVVAFADTLFRADFEMDRSTDGTIWVKQVDDPKAFGVVKIGEEGQITDFIEKPESFVSDLAIIGIYYFKDGQNLKSELQYLIDNDIREKGEYQLTNALENMKQKGLVFKPGQVNEWMDCGNKDVTVETNSRVLGFIDEDLIDSSVQLHNSEIIKPCYIGPNVVLKNSTVGPNVSVGADSLIDNCTIQNTIIQKDAVLVKMNLDNSMVGNHVRLHGNFRSISIGDYSTTE